MQYGRGIMRFLQQHNLGQQFLMAGAKHVSLEGAGRKIILTLNSLCTTQLTAREVVAVWIKPRCSVR